VLRIPPFFVANKGEHSSKVALILSTAKQRAVVRITGGCGEMSADDASGLYNLFAEAFTQSGFQGAMLYGGTRMLMRHDPSVILPGITEIVPHIAKDNNIVPFGVIPRTCDLAFDDKYGFVVSNEPGHDFFTVVHPEQKEFLIVQKSVDEPATWDTEWEECLNIIADMRKYGQWKSLLTCYNGGGVTERELREHARRGWPVIIVAGSGRTCNKYAEDIDFLIQHPSVMVVEKTVSSLRDGIMRALDEEVTEQDPCAALVP